MPSDDETYAKLKGDGTASKKSVWKFFFSTSFSEKKLYLDMAFFAFSMLKMRENGFRLGKNGMFYLKKKKIGRILEFFFD